MARFRCPECGAETEVTPKYGHEVVSVYCLAHAGGVDAHTWPVYMMRGAETVMAPEPKPVPPYAPAFREPVAV